MLSTSPTKISAKESIPAVVTSDVCRERRLTSLHDLSWALCPGNETPSARRTALKRLRRGDLSLSRVHLRAHSVRFDATTSPVRFLRTTNSPPNESTPNRRH